MFESDSAHACRKIATSVDGGPSGGNHKEEDLFERKGFEILSNKIIRIPIKKTFWVPHLPP
jgi:hypothetical protein